MVREGRKNEHQGAKKKHWQELQEPLLVVVPLMNKHSSAHLFSSALTDCL